MYALAKIVSLDSASRDRIFQLVERCCETTTFILRLNGKTPAPVTITHFLGSLDGNSRSDSSEQAKNLT
jgi:hypothetical protein